MSKRARLSCPNGCSECPIGWQPLPRWTQLDLDMFVDFARARRPFILSNALVQSFGFPSTWKELRHFEDHPQVRAMEALFNSPEGFRPIAVRCAPRKGDDQSGMSCPMTPMEALRTLRRREALGALAEDGLAMYLGAWEYDADDWTRGGADWSDGLNSELGSVPFARCIFKDELGEQHELCRSLRWIYIGEEGSGTSAHIDPLCSHGWMWLARGQKQWHLVTLEEAVAGCEAVPQGAPEDLFSVKGCKEFDAWLKRLNVRHQAWCGNLCEGELVFIPSGILHGVKNVGKGISIAVSHNFLDETCMTSVLGCLRQALQMLLDEMSRRSLSGALASLEQQLGPQARLLATSAEVLLPRLEKRGVDVADLIALSRSVWENETML